MNEADVPEAELPSPASGVPSPVSEIAKLVTPADRLHQVFTWIISGASQHEIEQAIAKDWPDAKPRPLIVAAMKRIAKAGDDEPDLVRGWAIEATRLIFQKALDVGDLQTALRALKQVVELSKK